MTATIAMVLRHIDSCGFVTKVFRIGEYCELHAVTLPAGAPVYIARSDGDDEGHVYAAACALAEMCGCRP